LALFVFGKGVKPLEKQFYTFSFSTLHSFDIRTDINKHLMAYTPTMGSKKSGLPSSIEWMEWITFHFSFDQLVGNQSLR